MNGPVFLPSHERSSVAYCESHDHVSSYLWTSEVSHPELEDEGLVMPWWGCKGPGALGDSTVTLPGTHMTLAEKQKIPGGYPTSFKKKF